MVMVAFSSFDTGQIFFAVSAASLNAASLAPGMRAVTVRCDDLMVKPPPSISPVIAAVVEISSAVRLDWPRTPESCIEKQAACAAAIGAFGVSMFVFDAFAFVQSTILFFAIAAIGLQARRLGPRPADS